ncbi:MAG: hypothetical protein HY805_05000 [Nitrospirae bacterium]|nr:hypothetical protein [Nitrospirota bacterium]
MGRKFLGKILIAIVVIIQIGLVSVFLFHEVFDLTSSNSAIYVLRSKTGGIEIKTDIVFDEASRIIFMLDATNVFNLFMKTVAVARDKPVLELTWNKKEGVGAVKEFREDGTMLSFSFSRFREGEGIPHGLFLGGELPYADTIERSSSGFGYYDGEKWFHIWCSANEGFSLSGSKEVVVPHQWKYLGSRVIKETTDKAIIESLHEKTLNGNKILMKRLASFRAGDDYFTLKVRITNASKNIILYGYAYGDEPWIGNFSSSEGDVGWYKGGLIKHEMYLSPLDYKYAGWWDYGNDAAGEMHNYTGYANFIEWVRPTPTYVYFSNIMDECCSESLPLNATFNRVINIVWLHQMLLPGESRDHVLAIGMAHIDPLINLPRKPEVRLD